MNYSIYEKRNIFGNLRNSNLLFGIRYGFEIFTMERALKDVPLLKISAVCIIAFDHNSPLKNGFLATMGVFRNSYLPRNGSPWGLICRNQKYSHQTTTLRKNQRGISKNGSRRLIKIYQKMGPFIQELYPGQLRNCLKSCII